jgi:signal transduction histidine kinase
MQRDEGFEDTAAVTGQQADPACGQIEAAVLAERNRIAREIHDTLAQAFTGILLQLRVGQRILDQRPDEAWSLVERAIDLAQLGLAEARRSIWALQLDSSEHADLVAALTEVVEGKRAGTDAEIMLHVSGQPREIGPDVVRGLIRVTEEAVTNALRHAAPRMVWVDLAFDGVDVRLRVQDDGCGFDVDRQGDLGGFGLIGMGQRAGRLGGKLAISSQPGRGTEVAVTVPAPPPADVDEP